MHVARHSLCKDSLLAVGGLSDDKYNELLINQSLTRTLNNNNNNDRLTAFDPGQPG